MSIRNCIYIIYTAWHRAHTCQGLWKLQSSASRFARMSLLVSICGPNCSRCSRTFSKVQVGLSLNGCNTGPYIMVQLIAGAPFCISYTQICIRVCMVQIQVYMLTIHDSIYRLHMRLRLHIQLQLQLHLQKHVHVSVKIHIHIHIRLHICICTCKFTGTKA